MRCRPETDEAALDLGNNDGADPGGRLYVRCAEVAPGTLERKVRIYRDN